VQQYEDWIISKKLVGDGRVLYVYPLTYGRARIGISPSITSQGFDDVW